MKWSKCQELTSGVPSSASFTVLLVALDTSLVEVLQSAEIIYRDLKMHGLNVLFDDRNEDAITKLKDAERLGLPIRLTIGASGLRSDKVEVHFDRHSIERPIERLIERPIECPIDSSKAERTNQQLTQMIRIDECVERVGEIANELLKIRKSSQAL